MLEAKDQGHKRKCFPKKEVFKKFFQVIYKISIIKKIVLSSSRGQAIFKVLRLRGPGQGLDLRAQGQEFQNVSSRPRTSLRTPPLSLAYCLSLTDLLCCFLIQAHSHYHQIQNLSTFQTLLTRGGVLEDTF